MKKITLILTVAILLVALLTGCNGNEEKILDLLPSDISAETNEVCRHSLMFISEKRPSCTEDGVPAHWYCTECNESFVDSNGKEKLHATKMLLSKIGHFEVTDLPIVPTTTTVGKTEGTHCVTCGAILVPQEVIPMLEKEELSVKYYNIKGAHISIETQSFKEDEVLMLPTIEANGYDFLGWFTMPNGDGEQLTYISKNNYVNAVYAYWTPRVYSITYFDTIDNNNPTSYTVEDSILIKNPTWSGLKFDGWTSLKGDVSQVSHNGTIYTRIEKGTVGDIELLANWKSFQNSTLSNDNDSISCVFDKDSQKVFLYKEIGLVSNILVGENFTRYEKTSDVDETVELSNSITIERSDVVEIAKMISSTIKNTTGKTEIESWILSKSLTENMEVTFGAGVNSKALEKSMEAKYGISLTSGKSYETVVENTESIEYGKEISNQTSTTIAYSKQMTTSESLSYTIDKNLPNGLYIYGKTVSVRVFIIVSYDPLTNEYYYDTYGIVDNPRNTVLYFRSEYEFLTPEANQLAFESPVKEIEDKMEELYFVRYDSNGGNGTMPISVMQAGKKQVIPTNQFTRDGYSFGGWQVIEDESVISINDGGTVEDLANPKETVILKANWVPNLYEVKFDSLNKVIKVEFDKKYETLPNPTKEGFIFDGWYYNGKRVQATTTMKIPSNHILVSKWKPISYAIVYNSNGGTGQTNASSYLYDEYKTLSPNGFARQDYTFLGWSECQEATVPTYYDGQEISKLTSTNNKTIILYAVWVRTFSSVTYNVANGTRDVRLNKGESLTETTYSGMSIAQLKANGFKDVRVTIYFDAKRTVPIGYNYGNCVLHTKTNAIRFTPEGGKYFPTEWTNYCVGATVPIDQMKDDGSVDMVWSTNSFIGTSFDGWILGTTTMIFEAIR